MDSIKNWWITSTLFTKIVVIAAVLAIILLAVSCNDNPGYYKDDYRVIRGPQGQEMVVVYDDDGREHLMEYILFQQLMNNGGYSAVYGARNRWTPYQGQYRSWNSSRVVPRTTYDYYKPSPPIRYEEEEEINVTRSYSGDERKSRSRSGSSLRTDDRPSRSNLRSSDNSSRKSSSSLRSESPSRSSSLRSGSEKKSSSSIR